MTSYRLLTSRNASHTRVSVYAGPDREHRAFCGALTFRHGEAGEFVARMVGHAEIVHAPKTSSTQEDLPGGT